MPTAFVLSAAGVGIAAGLAGVLTGLLLRTVQQLAYGDSSGDAFAFLPPGNPALRIGLLGGAGLLVALGWWGLHRVGRSPVSITDAVHGKRMRTVPMVVHVFLQMVSVGVGGSIGREVAPRELGALSAWWTERLAPVLTARQRRLLIASGAGAGLASAYHVPVAGALFAVEILLAEFSLTAVVVASVVSGIAALVSWVLVPGGAIYSLPPVSFSPSLLVWAIAAGPLLGFASTGFSRLAHRAATHRQRGWPLLVTLPLTFAAIGAVSLILPEVLGNGQSLAAPAFAAHISVVVAVVLFATKAAATVAMIRAGAYGGTLTPSLSLGALFGLATGTIWMSFWPGSSVTAFALCGAAAFLGGSMAAPLTALALTVELTGSGEPIIVPLVVAVGLSTLVRWLIDTRATRARRLLEMERTEPSAEESVPT
jgi:CIC family chloride channel protein